ncbi:MAG: hypothetical protein FRX49_08922 [Trebouxia sp. A1-2]|nr:MAG: hypothetical protein FRX49_08922 [Trebouxia sp. A1-2]
MHVWLQPCRRRTAAGNVRISESFSQQAFAQPHTASGVRCQATAAQPQKQQGKDPNAGLPDISQLSPKLQQEWHPDNNALLGGIQHSSLATKAPRQTRYWNHDKNAKTPEQTLAGTNLRAEWKCPTCSYEWQAPVAQRVRDDSGCPPCNKSASIGNKNSQPTFEASQHPLLLDWDYERNTQDSIHPQNITLGSRKMVHWVCHKCPKGQLHQYQTMPKQRTRRQGSGCPYCAGKQVCKCNSLEAHAPTLSLEWDFFMNKLSLADVTSQSHQVRGGLQEEEVDLEVFVDGDFPPDSTMHRYCRRAEFLPTLIIKQGAKCPWHSAQQNELTAVQISSFDSRLQPWWIKGAADAYFTTFVQHKAITIGPLITFLDYLASANKHSA